MGRSIARLSFLAAAVFLGTEPAMPDEEKPRAFEYVRDKTTIGRTVESISARTKDADAVLYVFDTATFDPPPGRTEFTSEYAFKDDLPAWGFALSVAAKAAAPRVFVAASTSDGVTPLTPGTGFETVLHELESPWWTASDFDGFEPAHKQVARLAAKLPGGNRVIVLVSGASPPERWVRRPSNAPGVSEPWRSRLRDVGEYLDAEKLGSAAVAAGASLVVVAPETRLGDFLPAEEIPWAPWASRPVADALPPPAADVATPAAPGAGQSPEMSEDEIQRLAAQMRRQGIDEGLVQAFIQAARRKSNHKAPVTPGPGEDTTDDPARGGRFDGRTPRWTRQVGQQIPFATDVPSAYGFWPLARAAAKAGGAYYFYPFPTVDWADTCPRDMSLIDAMQPELVPEGEFVLDHGSDPAEAAMLAAQKLVLDVTPWTDVTKGWTQGGAPSWCGFVAAAVRTPKWRPREKPRDWMQEEFEATAKSWREVGSKIADAVPAYDRALTKLTETYARLEAAKWAGVPRRSRANLRLCRFWFETSAFHLEALSIYLKELKRFMPPGSDDRKITVTYVPTIRLSDCLDAYDGRVITPTLEARYAAGAGPSDLDAQRGYQGNPLAIPVSDRNYRARRDLTQVLKNVDPRLRPRALRVIDAGRDVMTHDAKSPWGWSTYYTDVHTFIWREVVTVEGNSSLPHLPDDPGNGPSTPTGPGSGGGGGPTTK